MSGSMRASYQLRRGSSSRLESPFSWGFLGVLLLALELLLPMCSGQGTCAEPPKFKTMKTKFDYGINIISGLSIEYVCCPGHKPITLFSSLFTVCQADGTWSPTLQESCTNSVERSQELQKGAKLWRSKQAGGEEKGGAKAGPGEKGGEQAGWRRMRGGGEGRSAGRAG
ncbi:hypothetical protein QTO34_011536 [Cnephaeus nilssonii]|uniref:Sushi domain-containing protein n=1 Tax=Cnephaeus nilssonii TaxID=3371016 RepID=A0AA40HEJ4_CNENI|nr:hypothetical protein QTO34_011536 [Eptesicus nilssonii]